MKRNIIGRLISINPLVFKSLFRLVKSDFDLAKIAIKIIKFVIPARTINPYPINNKSMFEVRK